MSEKARTSAEIQTEYANLCAQLGEMYCRMGQTQAQISCLVEQITALSAEFAQAKQEEENEK